MCVFLVSPLSLVKNPMILLAIVALVFTLGMPKLMENSTCFTCFHLSPSFYPFLANSISGSGNARRIRAAATRFAHLGRG